MKPIPNECKRPVMIMIVVGVVITVFFFVFNRFFSDCMVKDDPLNKEIFKIGSYSFSWWPVTHLILFAILGFFYSECWLMIMVLGIVWELFEYSAGWIFPNRRRKFVTGKGVQYNDKWWAPNVFDPIFNAIGFLIGWSLSKLKKNRPNKNKEHGTC